MLSSCRNNRFLTVDGPNTGGCAENRRTKATSHFSLPVQLRLHFACLLTLPSPREELIPDSLHPLAILDLEEDPQSIESSSSNVVLPAAAFFLLLVPCPWPIMDYFYQIEDKDGARFSWNIWPSTKQDANNLVIPLGCLYTPLKRSQAPLVYYEPIMCKGACKSLLNPFWYVQSTKRFFLIDDKCLEAGSEVPSVRGFGTLQTPENPS